jgi:hypothetical protein
MNGEREDGCRGSENWAYTEEKECVCVYSSVLLLPFTQSSSPPPLIPTPLQLVVARGGEHLFIQCFSFHFPPSLLGGENI